MSLSRRLDRIEVTGIRAWGRHGVLPAETEHGQTFAADITLHLWTAPAGRSDRLERTVDYSVIAQLVREEIQGEPAALVETLAERIAARILTGPGRPFVRHAQVRIRKPSAPVGLPVDDIAVTIGRDAEPVPAVLALGSNLGDREEHLGGALARIAAADGVELEWTSPVMRTAPVGGPDGQDPFLNAVIGIRTELGPWELLELAQDAERSAQRERTVRWGPRTLDVDVITYGSWSSEDPELMIPHPRAPERAFVLGPWHAARPADELPGHGPIVELLGRCADREGLAPGPELEGFGIP